MSRKGENIYKRKDGRWEGRYKKILSNDTTQYFSVYGKTYNEVKQKLLKAKTSVNYSKSNIYMFNDIALEWLNNTKPNIKHSTFVKYTNIVNNHLLPYFVKSRIENITTSIVKDYVAMKLQNGNIQTNKPLSPKTVKDIVSVLKMILEYGDSEQQKSICNFKQIYIKSSQQSPNTLSDSSQAKLTEYLLNEPNYTKLGILLCLYTGIRIGELCAMKFEDIFVDEKVIRISKTMQRLQNFSDDAPTKTSIIVSTPKSQSSQREIPLPEFLIDSILKFNYSSKDYILTGRNDKYIEPRTLEYRFKSCLNECGLTDYKFHQLRHRFATNCIELGFDVKCLSEILGHSSVNITLNKYVYTSMDLKRINMNKLQCNIVY